MPDKMLRLIGSKMFDTPKAFLKELYEKAELKKTNLQTTKEHGNYPGGGES